MRDPARIPRILAALQALWERHPDMRLGQLIVTLTPPRMKGDPFYYEDDDLERRLDVWNRAQL